MVSYATPTTRAVRCYCCWSQFSVRYEASISVSHPLALGCYADGFDAASRSHPPAADYGNGLAVNVEAAQAVERKVGVVGASGSPGRLPVERHQQGDGVFGHGVRASPQRGGRRRRRRRQEFFQWTTVRRWADQ